MKTKKSRLREIWEADPNFPRRETAMRLHLAESTVDRYVREFTSEINLIANPHKSKAKKRADCPNLRTLSVTDLIDNERLDIKKIIHEGIASLPAGQVAYDDSFRRDLQIAEPRWREYSREEEFDDYRAMLPNRKIVWGNKATINKVLQMDGVT